MSFRDVKVGDTVTRLLSGVIPMKMKVTRVDEDVLYCGTPCGEDGWTFCRDTGAEIDEDIPILVSYLVKEQ